MNKRVLIILLFASILFVLGDEKEIFLIESYHEEYLWDIRYKEGLDSILSSEYKIRSFYMDTKRLPESEFQKMSDLAFKEYKTVKPDLVILGDDNSLKYLWKRFSYEDVPVVFLGINGNPRDYFKKTPENFTGVLERPLLHKSIGYLLRIDHELKKVLILFDSGITSKAIVNELFRNKRRFRIGRVHVDYEMIGSWNRWKNSVLKSGINGYDAIIMGSFYTIKDGKKYIHPEEVIKWTSTHTPVPPYTFWDYAIGKDKVIGGLVDSGKPQGIEAGKMVITILEDGVSPSDIPFKTIEEVSFVFSRNQLEKYKIKLPSYIKSRAKFLE